jgi:hypothetical protein
MRGTERTNPAIIPMPGGLPRGLALDAGGSLLIEPEFLKAAADLGHAIRVNPCEDGGYNVAIVDLAAARSTRSG